MKPLIVGHRALYDDQGRPRLVPVHVGELGPASARVAGSYALDCRALLVGEFAYFLPYYEKNKPPVLRGFSENLVKSAALLPTGDRKAAYLRLAECLQRRAGDLDAGLYDPPVVTTAAPAPPPSSRPRESNQRTLAPSQPALQASSPKGDARPLPPQFQVAKAVAPRATPALLAQPATAATPPRAATMLATGPRPTIK